MAEDDQGAFQPVHFVAWLAIPSLYILALMALYFLAFSALCRYSFGRKLLLDHPKLFTMGTFSHEGESAVGHIVGFLSPPLLLQRPDGPAAQGHFFCHHPYGPRPFAEIAARCRREGARHEGR